ncbi:unnamed protein product [Urochloa decumbens]|uniref:Uncharacterized protein n=1 Tax=Urochloa decumbens TaxID=240449 RepID=A0ABC8Z3B3_9POAL
MAAAAATALVVAFAESSLPSKAEDLLMLAEKLGTAADHCGVPKTRLVAAADKLSRAEESTRLEAVLELGSAADAMGEAAATLAHACKGFGHLVGAIRAVRAAAEEEAARPRGFAGCIKAWWAKLRQSKNSGVPDPEAPLLARGVTSSHSHKGATVADLPAAGQDSNWRSERIAGCSAMQGCALVASLTLLPYMGPDGMLKANVYGLWYRQVVGVSFSLIWCLVSVSVPCLFVRSRLLHFL